MLAQHEHAWHHFLHRKVVHAPLCGSWVPAGNHFPYFLSTEDPRMSLENCLLRTTLPCEHTFLAQSASAFICANAGLAKNDSVTDVHFFTTCLECAQCEARRLVGRLVGGFCPHSHYLRGGAAGGACGVRRETLAAWLRCGNAPSPSMRMNLPAVSP